MELVIGTTYRLRFMWIAANNVLTTTLRDRSGPVMVRGLAYDGHDQSPVISFPLRLSIGPGHTGDFEFTPTEPGNMTLELAYGPNTGVTNVPATIMPIRVPTP
jgi:hypothetical protein